MKFHAITCGGLGPMMFSEIYFEICYLNLFQLSCLPAPSVDVWLLRLKDLARILLQDDYP